MIKRLILCFTFLVLCLCSFSQFKIDTEAYERQKREAFEVRERQRIQDSIRIAQIEEAKIMANDVRFRIKWNNMLTFRQNVGFIESSSNISYYGYFSTRKAWTYPISIKLSSSRSYNDNALKDGYDDWSQHLTYLGMTGIRRINPDNDFYFSLGGYLPLGWERYRFVEDNYAKKHTHFLTGVNAEQRILYISPNKVGLMLGAGVYERLMTSKLYSLDIGLTLEVGIKF